MYSMNSHIFINTGTIPCGFEPFQLIPYSHNDRSAKFTVRSDIVNTLLRCDLLMVYGKGKSQVKFPDNATEMKLPWLARSYVNFTVSNRDLYFKVRYSFLL